MKQLDFDKNVSELLRGIAIILMVTNHCYPGSIIPCAVPLFSFMVGYGYNFARDKSWRNSLHRIWHLLGDFWFVLFAICLPTALYVKPEMVHTDEVLLNMFGLNGRLNFFCWYVYFYIIVMFLMPVCSRIIDKRGYYGYAGLVVLSLGLAWLMRTDDLYKTDWYIIRLYKVAYWMPVVLSGYLISKYKLYQKIKYRPGVGSALIAVVGMAAAYLVRGIENIQAFDFITIPILVGFVSLFFGTVHGKWITTPLSRLGLMSMNIWFLHALFFTHLTRPVFLPLVEWAAEPVMRVLAILTVSWIMAEIVTKMYGGVKKGVEICYTTYFKNRVRNIIEKV